MESQQQQQSASLSLEDCLKLLKGERDEQRLAGLFLVTKICKGVDHASLVRVYDAVGPRFLDRLLRTGIGKGAHGDSGSDNRDAYLQLSTRVLAAFCRVPEIASSDDMVRKIPLFVEILLNESGSANHEDCFEVLYLVSTSSEGGIMTLYESGGMKALATQMSILQDGSHMMKLAMQLFQLIISKLSLAVIVIDYSPELVMIVAVITKQFAILHDATKFEALHLLSAIFSSNLTLLNEALRQMPNNDWSNHMRDGIAAILHNRVAPVEKLQALTLAESLVSILGECWLIADINLPDVQGPIPKDRCLLLILEQSRVEVAVLLNELAYLKYEATKNSSSHADTILLKKRNVAVAFSLVEKIIKLISNQGDLLNENTIMKVIRGINETTGVVLEYLQDAKEHGQRKGDDLLASVRVIGSYLAETPLACKEKVRELLEYMLSVEGENEQSPFYSICFLLPMLCQMTMTVEGCQAFASSRGYKDVVECLIKLIGQSGGALDDSSLIFLACDTILNLLLQKEKVQFNFDESAVANLLKALAHWAENSDDPSVIMMAASICTLILDYTTEDALLRNPNFNCKSLNSLFRLFSRIAASSWQGISDDAKEHVDLLEIVKTGYARWASRFPHLREVVEQDRS